MRIMGVCNDNSIALSASSFWQVTCSGGDAPPLVASKRKGSLHCHQAGFFDDGRRFVSAFLATPSTPPARAASLMRV